MKILDNGIAIIPEDTHASRWVESVGRLDHDGMIESCYLPLCDPEKTTLDVGANIGTHTFRYAERSKKVVAYEPNSLCYDCLIHNVVKLGNVVCCNFGLGSRNFTGTIRYGQSGNIGSGFMEESPDGKVQIYSLDEIGVAEGERVGYIKVDIEGMEFDFLLGACQTIKEHKPRLVLAMQEWNFKMRRVTFDDIFRWLADNGYRYKPLYSGWRLTDSQYDLLAWPANEA